jgi:hypothetical protein
MGYGEVVMGFEAGQILEVPHAIDNSRMRVVVVSVEPLRCRTIAYRPAGQELWVSRIGAVDGFTPPDGTNVLGHQSFDTPRQLAIASNRLSELAIGIQIMSQALSSVGQKAGL